MIKYAKIISILFFVIGTQIIAFGQLNGVNTYMNPVLPGNHPDQTLLKVGNDFYTAGSSFHWTPNFPIFHSTDLIHWKVVSNVVSPTWTGIIGEDAPKDGTWQGALAYFAGKYWAYFFIHGKGQYCANATSMTGPWSTPTLVANSVGYDNAIFVDDDGKAYMLMKNGQTFAAIQELNTNGQLTGTRMDMSWVNANNIYSWAEGPKMCKRNGRYYYFCAGNVYGGQYVLSSAVLSGNEADWTRHGNFFRGTASGPFTGPNHITNPVQIADGTWWCLGHSYGNNGWEGQGRQSMLFQVLWDANNVPYANNPNGLPLTAPNLAHNGNKYDFPTSDQFSSTTRKPEWFFFNLANIQKASVAARAGYLRLTPGAGTTHILQRDPCKQYSVVTKVEINATANGQHAGIRLMNGEDLLFANVYSGYNNGKKIGISFNGVATEVNNTIGNIVWLKLVRNQHNITGYYGADGITWTQIGNAVSLVDLDKAQTNDNAWVGTALGLYATAQTADFDQFSFNHGLDAISVASYYHYSNTSIATGTVTNSADGAWCMIPGVTMESTGMSVNTIEVNAASANSTGVLEVWLNNIGTAGTKIATIPITSSGGATTYKNYTANVSVSGQHDVYLRFIGAANIFRLNTIKFLATTGPAVSIALTSPSANQTYTAPATVSIAATATITGGTISKVEFYNGTTKLGEDATSPYTYSWTNVAAGTYSITAVATDNTSATTTSTAVSIKVSAPKAPYGGTAHPIPGKIEFEHFDEGGNGVGYLDNTPGSAVTPVVNFRTTEDVDIENCTDAGAGYNIGYATAGEWLEYSVNVATAGTYNITLRAATDAAKTVSLQAKGVAIATNLAIPATGGWQVWQDVVIPNVTLTAGAQVIRLTIGATDYVNLNYMTYALAVTTPTPTVTSPVTYCQGATAIALTATGTALKWYTAATGGTASTTAPTPSTANAGTTTHYVSQTVNGVESSRAAISVVVNALPTATITPSGSTTFCNGSGSVTLQANTGTGLTYQWWRNQTTATGTGAATHDIYLTSGSYTVEITNANGCKAISAPVVVTVNTPPAAPTVTSPVLLNTGQTATALTATGTALKWYTVATGGTASTTAPIPSTVAVGTTTYYVSQTVNACESPRAAIEVIVATVIESIQLQAGWNMIGCPLQGSTNMQQALSSIWSNVETIKDQDSFWDNKNVPALNSLSNLIWGKGYLVKVKTSCTLDWIVK